MKRSGLILIAALVIVLSDLGSPCPCENVACSTIHTCYNCETPKASSCLTSYTGVDENTCRSYIAPGSNTKALYARSTQECKLTSSTCPPRYSATYDVLFSRTCDTGCSNYTFTRQNGYVVVSSDTPDIVYSTSYSARCVEKCWPLSQSCTVSHNSGSGDCIVYSTSCGGSCSTLPSSGWSVYTATCNSVAGCPTLTDPVNGVVDKSAGTSPGAQAIYSCYTGYQMSGYSMTTCGSGGNWDNAAPTCSPVDCGQPSGPVNGSFYYSLTTFGSFASFSCDTGFVVSGSSSASCDSNGIWTSSVPAACMLVDCGSPSGPNNGTVLFSSTTYGSQANYNCLSGYTLQGPSTTNCESNGYWDNSSPTCAPVDCGPPSNVTDGSVAYTSTMFSSQANYNCDTGFTIAGLPTTTCGFDGSWDNPAPTCTPVNCGNLTNPDYGFVMVTENTYGTYANYTCVMGYMAPGSNYRTCLSNGSWELPEPQCAPIDCGPLANPSHGSVFLPSGTTFNAMATFSCDSGYVLSHMYSRLCQGNALWSGTSPTCDQSGMLTTEASVVYHLYIMPCICYSNKTFSDMTQEEIVQKLIVDTKIDTKTTTLAQSKRESRADPRLSSKMIGVVAVVTLSIVGGLLLIADIITIRNSMKQFET